MPPLLHDLIYMLLFPGLLFLMFFAFAAEYIDRKLHARLQNRMGPPWFQPLADFIKLAAKQDLMPVRADYWMFRLTPIVALAATLTAFLYIPVWGRHGLMSFNGDLIVVLYLLTIPTFTFFLGGWYSRSVFSMIGAARALMQLFAYEIPLYLAVLAPALLAGSWSLADITAFYARNPLYAAFNVVGLGVALVALLGKLERVPFDIPEAETEIVAGAFTEYSGRLLAIFRLAISIEMVVGATLLAAVFLPFGLAGSDSFSSGAIGFGLYLVKVIGLVCVMTLMRSLLARLRLDQMINFCWKVAAPVAFLQVLLNLSVKFFLPA
jgi:NADH-quinone oxidoreductase subunit H